AVESFRNALSLLGTNKTKLNTSKEQSEDSLLLQALDAFNSAVNMNLDHAEAHHWCADCAISAWSVHLSRAALYGAQGRYAKAGLDCNEAIRIQPKSVRAYLYKRALKLKFESHAVEDLTMAIQLDSACSFAYYNRGVCFHELRDYELALRDYSTTLLLGCKTELELKVLINSGLLYVELNDYDSALQLQEAVDAYSQALRLDPFLQDSHVGRGNVLMDYQVKSSQVYLNPLCSSARISLAYSLQVLGFFQRAWNQFTVAVEVNPKCWPAYEGRAVTSLQMGNMFAALQDINTAIKCNPHAEQLFTNRGLIQQLMRDKASAMKNYQTAFSLNPGYALAYFNAANLFFYNGQFEQACKYYSRAFELDPSDESAILNRAITHALLRKVPASLQDFSESFCLNMLSAHVYYNRANLYCSLRQFQSAERDLTQGVSVHCHILLKEQYSTFEYHYVP
uniref:Tetratricopeptide repeat domain 6 n=1 Tax=Sinocyclocheilus anshuiensis TaxID=1608454 RepID=A0A671LE92_9TELE